MSRGGDLAKMRYAASKVSSICIKVFSYFSSHGGL